MKDELIDAHVPESSYQIVKELGQWSCGTAYLGRKTDTTEILVVSKSNQRHDLSKVLENLTTEIPALLPEDLKSHFASTDLPIPRFIEPAQAEEQHVLLIELPSINTKIGTVVGNKYKLLKELGKGTYGTTYLALNTETENPALNGVCVVKLMNKPQTNGLAVLQAFSNEAKALTRVHHAQIPDFLDWGILEDESFYIVEEYVSGNNLRSIFARNFTFDESAAVQFLKDILKPLGALHEARIIHRDIKPENIMFDEYNRPVIVDLGSAKVSVLAMKMTGTIAMGTIGYAAPEVRYGKSSPSSDLYSVGLVLVEGITGCPAESLWTPNGFIWKEVPRLRDGYFTEKFIAIVDKLISDDHVQRFQCAGQVLQALSELPGQNRINFEQESLTITRSTAPAIFKQHAPVQLTDARRQNEESSITIFEGTKPVSGLSVSKKDIFYSFSGAELQTWMFSQPYCRFTPHEFESPIVAIKNFNVERLQTSKGQQMVWDTPVVCLQDGSLYAMVELESGISQLQEPCRVDEPGLKSRRQVLDFHYLMEGVRLRTQFLTTDGYIEGRRYMLTDQTVLRPYEAAPFVAGKLIPGQYRPQYALAVDQDGSVYLLDCVKRQSRNILSVSPGADELQIFASASSESYITQVSGDRIRTTQLDCGKFVDYVLPNKVTALKQGNKNHYPGFMAGDNNGVVWHLSPDGSINAVFSVEQQIAALNVYEKRITAGLADGKLLSWYPKEG